MVAMVVSLSRSVGSRLGRGDGRIQFRGVSRDVWGVKGWALTRRAVLRTDLVARQAFLTAALTCLVALTGCSSRAGHPAQIATGYISHVVCSYVFVSALDPARVNAEDVVGN